MTRRDLLRACAAAPLAATAGAQNRYQPTWESIDSRPSPGWYPGAILAYPGGSSGGPLDALINITVPSLKNNAAGLAIRTLWAPITISGFRSRM